LSAKFDGTVKEPSAKQEVLFSDFNKEHGTSSTIPQPNKVDNISSWIINFSGPLSVFSEGVLQKPALLPLINFSYLGNALSFDLIEDSYENLKSTGMLYSSNFKVTNSLNTNFLKSPSYSSVLNYFRTDFEETNWNMNASLTKNNENFFLVGNKVDLLTNPLKLRSTARNLLVTYNAVQKVFKSRFDDGRTNTNFQDFSNSFLDHSFITGKKSSFETMLTKNKEFFFSPTFFFKKMNKDFSIFLEVFNSNNFLFSNVPFLLSLKSDASRYLWFDWQSR